MATFYETKNYSRFKLMDANRKINKNNLNNIKKSLETKGWLGGSIIVNENYEIIDGQHRFFALKELDMPIVYEIRKGYGASEVQALNVAQKSWTVVDTIESEANRGNQSYKWLDDLRKRFKFMPPHLIAKLMYGQSREGARSALTNRYFVVSYEDYKRVEGWLELLAEIKPLVDLYVGRKAPFYDACCYCFSKDEIDNRQLVEKISKYMTRSINRLGTFTDALKDLELVYNKYQRDVYVPIWAMYQKDKKAKKVKKR